MVILFRHDDQELILDNFYKMPNPPKEVLDKRQKEVDALKLELGDKYLLAKNVEKKNG